MYEAQPPRPSNASSTKVPRMVQVKSIEVEFKEHDTPYGHNIFIVFRVADEEPYKSVDLMGRKIVHWKFKKRIEIGSKFTISIFKHNYIFSNELLGSIRGSVDQLYMKPFVLFAGGNVTVKVECEAAGAFVDLIGHLFNEAQNQLEKKKAFLDGLRNVCEGLNYVVSITDIVAEVHPAVKAAVTVVSALCDFCNKVEECHEAATGLMKDIATYLSFTEIPGDCLKGKMTSKTVQEMLEVFEKIARAMIDYSTGSILGKFPEDRLEEICSFKKKFVKLKETFGWCVQTEIWKTTLKIEANTDALLLKHLEPVTDAFYKSEKGCFNGSRRDTLRAVEEWSSTSDGPKLLWLHGPPAFGKTTIAHTVAKLFHGENRLAGCFFSDKVDPMRQNAKKIIPTIAYQLAKWHADYYANVVSVLQGCDEPCIHSGMSDQYELLIKRPLTEAPPTSPPSHKPLIIVLDGVDRCDNPTDSRRSLASFITQIGVVVPWLKVFVSSRTSSKLRAFETDDVQQIDLADASLDLHHDVATWGRYREEIEAGSVANSEQFECDVRGLFYRISESLKAMHVMNAETFETDGTNGQPTLESLFLPVTRAVIEKEGRDERTRSFVRGLIITITCIALRKPLSEGLLPLLQPFHAETTIEQLRAAISSIHPLVIRDGIGNFQTIFPSFKYLEFLSDEERSGSFHTDLPVVHTKLAGRCLEVLLSQLRFNICGLESSHRTNKEVLHLESRIKEEVSDVLQYSSLYWMDHILYADGVQNLRGPLLDLLCTTRALYWIEVLSFVGALEIGKGILQECRERFKEDDHIAHAAKEWLDIISEFSDAIGTSTPHVYVSALSWSSPGSFVRSICRGALRIPSVLACEEAGDLHPRTSFREESILQRSGLTDSLHYARYPAFSRDGSRIASGHRDGSLQIWNMCTGELIFGPLKGHTNDINDITFSPDNTRIATASNDGTLRIWDAQTGNSLAELKGHTDLVRAVAYSPDGKRVVSGSWDWTVRIWDARTGDPIGKPLKGHKDAIFSVAYSPDGSRIVSGSGDRTLRIWDAQSGAAIGEPLRGCKDSIWCVAYSPDGSRIVSGSGDCTLRIWDAQTGLPVGEPMKEHESDVWSVAYSPDGGMITSGSWDDTVRICDARTGAAIGVIPRDESRWDADARCFLSISSWCPRESPYCPPTPQALIHSDAPLYIPDDGWLRTLDGGLFIWVPPKHRRDVCCSGPMGKIDPVLRFEWKKVLHGKDWTKIMDACSGSDDH